MNQQVFKNILLVSGSGRDCGKTTLICDIIAKISKNEKVVALKISPHVHRTGDGQEIVESGDNYIVFRETDKNSGKDSSRMLQAGAAEVYFILCNDENLHHIDSFINKIAKQGYPTVCESGSFAGRYTPGLHILIQGYNPDTTKQSYLKNLRKSDNIITSESVINGNYLNKVSFEEGSWFNQSFE